MIYHFKDWVDKNGGIKKTAKDLQVGEHTLRVWLRGDGCPSHENTLFILHISKHKINYQQLHRETTRNKNKDK